MQAVRGLAQRHSVDVITLNVYYFNDNAIDFYDSEGFIERNMTMELTLNE